MSDDKLNVVREVMERDFNYLTYKTSLPLKVLKTVLYQTLLGLRDLHSANLCHGALCPSHILTKGTEAKLVDATFGQI